MRKVGARDVAPSPTSNAPPPGSAPHDGAPSLPPTAAALPGGGATALPPAAAALPPVAAALLVRERKVMRGKKGPGAAPSGRTSKAGAPFAGSATAPRFPPGPSARPRGAGAPPPSAAAARTARSACPGTSSSIAASRATRHATRGARDDAHVRRAARQHALDAVDAAWLLQKAFVVDSTRPAKSPGTLGPAASGVWP